MILFHYCFNKRRRFANLFWCLVNLVYTRPLLVLTISTLFHFSVSAISSYYHFNAALDQNTLSLNDFPSSYIKALNDSLAADTEFVAPSDANLPIHPEGYIPPIIHRTYKSLQFPSKWTEAFNSCQTFNPEFTHYYWTDVSARELIETHFEWFLPTYNSYQYSIQRVDALRYFLLWHYGGIYIDMDIGCRRNLTPLLSYPAWVPRTWPFGVSNDLMASSPRHPLMMKVALSLQDHNRWYISKYITVFFSTGPMFLSGILAAWFKSQPTRLGPGTDLDKISILGGSSGRDTQEILNSNFKKPHGLAFLPSMLYDTTDYTFFGHYPGSTWHGNDVAAIMWLYQHIWLLCVICIMLYITVHVTKTRRRWKRHSFSSKAGWV